MGVITALYLAEGQNKSGRMGSMRKAEDFAFLKRNIYAGLTRNRYNPDSTAVEKTIETLKEKRTRIVEGEADAAEGIYSN